MAKLIVQGPDAAAVLSRLSANDVDRRNRAHRLHAVARRRGRHHRRPDRDLARAGEVPGHRQRRHPSPGRADDPAGDPARRGRHRDRHDLGDDPALGAGPGVAQAAEPADRQRPVQCRVPVPVRPADPRRLRARAGRSRHLRRRARLRAARAGGVRRRRLRRPDGRRRRSRRPAGRSGRDDQPAAGEGLPRLRRRHRQHRHPAGGRAGIRGRLGQARRLRRS